MMDWEFWIDVGGTFTDCIAFCSSTGEFRRHKTLSSGVVKGTIEPGSTRREIVDRSRALDAVNFWNGFKLRILDASGSSLSEAVVQQFDPTAHQLILDSELNHDPSGLHYELSSELQSPILCIRYLLGCGIRAPLPPIKVRLGTTKGTNALLTRTGARVAFAATKGFRDILEIGYQDRPKLFELDIKKPKPLYDSVIEIDERIDANGVVLKKLDAQSVRQQLIKAKDEGAESLAICLLHSFRNPSHEQTVRRVAEEVGFDEVSVSSEISPLIKIVPRGDTTVVDAYLNPLLRNYVSGIGRSLHPDSDLQLLTSSGSVVPPREFTGKDSILSGPAGGVVGFSNVAKAAGHQRAIGFDMGGTSTDVSRYDGQLEMSYENNKAGVRIASPMLAIETVAAGGGSICEFDGVKLTVGPASAGAFPGPACYGRGGPLTVTDVNLLLGRIQATSFPFQLDVEAVHQRLDRLVDRIQSSTGHLYSREDLADGFRQIANANMTRAIRSISLEKGCDPSEYALVPFGGAAGQHACSIAEELSIDIILDHPDAGILSALGAGYAPVTRHAVKGIYKPYEDCEEELETILLELGQRAALKLESNGFQRKEIKFERVLELRYEGLEATIAVPEPAHQNFAEAYHARHQQQFGFKYDNRPIEVVAARVAGSVKKNSPPKSMVAARSFKAQPTRQTNVYANGKRHTINTYRRSELTTGATVTGPAIVSHSYSTLFLEIGWIATAHNDGTLKIERIAKESNRITTSTESDPISLELFNSRFSSIADQMGKTLQNTSSSVNVKERLDFSCAIFTAEGELVVNAPHIPVHLGAMGETVRHIARTHTDMVAGDVFITNDPFHGGSHLPDVTVVTPVFGADNEIRFFVASRAHHAEIGGIAPGSMPAFSQNLAEEGVLIRSFKIVEAGESQIEKLRRLLLDAPFPTRNVDDNLTDALAQIAANQTGCQQLDNLIKDYSWLVVSAYMQHIQTAAEKKTRAALENLGNGNRNYRDHLDDGSQIQVSIAIDGDNATLDFTGTGSVLPNNFNANRAIVSAAILYCLRCLIDEEIPLNEGVLKPVTIVLPECFLNPPVHADPAKCAAVACGNVETSQRIVDVVLGAFGLAAASQGTMNNLLFGDSTFGYYETICGGAGATKNFDGASAVHTHMTNTRLTDPEILESRYPVRVERFSIRQQSGGLGKHRGGDGIVRVLRFLKPLQVSLLTQRRGPYAPYGVVGGKPGKLGGNKLLRADGQTLNLGSVASLQVVQGDMLTIETPGGGGYGSFESDS